MKPPKPKAINFSLIPAMDNGHEPEPYKILHVVREQWHQDLDGAKIALAWRKRLKSDKDGHLMLGKCVKGSDLQRELAPYDFVILLNREVWQDSMFTLEKKTALLDHELCHAARVHDKLGLPASDEYGRSVWRTRKHDIEEFREIVERHGCYKKDLEAFAAALLKNRGNLVLPGIAADKPAPEQETSVEERIRTRKTKKKLQGQDALLPDNRNVVDRVVIEIPQRPAPPHAGND